MTITDLILCTMNNNSLGRDFLKGIVIVLCVIVFIEQKESTTLCSLSKANYWSWQKKLSDAAPFEWTMEMDESFSILKPVLSCLASPWHVLTLPSLDSCWTTHYNCLVLLATKVLALLDVILLRFPPSIKGQLPCLMALCRIGSEPVIGYNQGISHTVFCIC